MQTNVSLRSIALLFLVRHLAVVMIFIYRAIQISQQAVIQVWATLIIILNILLERTKPNRFLQVHTIFKWEKSKFIEKYNLKKARKAQVIYLFYLYILFVRILYLSKLCVFEIYSKLSFYEKASFNVQPVKIISNGFVLI